MSIKIEDLLQNKGILDEKVAEKKDQIIIKSLKDNNIGDGTLVYKSITMDKVQDINKMAGEDTFKSHVLACYEGVVEPNLKDKTLQEGFDCKTNPHGIVEKLFDPSEIIAISNKIQALSGMGKTENEIIEEIKN